MKLDIVNSKFLLLPKVSPLKLWIQIHRLYESAYYEHCIFDSL